ncbi:MAG: pyridoxal phosphate-dependent decarboxylase family protein [Gemmatimonadaceae bacterium]
MQSTIDSVVISHPFARRDQKTTTDMTTNTTKTQHPVPTLPPVTGDLSPDVFREHGHQLIEWIASYLEHPERYPVLSQVAPGDIRAALHSSPPTTGEPVGRIIEDFERVIVPGITHWNHPSFFAYFAISASVPGILGELLAAALDTNAMLWKSSPSATELEIVVLDWLRQAIGLEPGWFGVINDTASISTMLALAAARESADLDVRERGLAGRSDIAALRVYCSEQAHSSVDKGAITLGFGHENVVHIGVDDEFRMRPDLLQAAISADRERGFIPIAVVATVGTTSTTSIDPVPAIADICEREDIWLHVDGAYGGAAGIVPELRHYLDGVDRADSLVVNPHKWLFTPVDCSAFWVKDPSVLKRAFSLVPEYLVTREQDEVVNLMDYGVQLGRRFRSLKLWMVMRSFGTDGLASRIREHVRLAQEFATWVELEREWELMAPHPFSLVCFRYAPEGASQEERNSLNQKILDGVNATGEAFLSHTKLSGQFALRLAIGNIRTEQRNVAQVWQLLLKAAKNVSN